MGDLDTTTIPAGVKVIGKSEFSGCINIKKIVIPSTVTEIGEYAFYECKSLEEVSLSEGLQVIGRSAFKGCINIKKIVVPSTVTKIGEYAFYECKSLEEVSLSEGLQVIRKATFSYCGIKEVNLPDGLISIGESAFFFCENLEKVNLPDSLQVINCQAFSCCVNLSKVIIPGNTQIESFVFEACENLKVIVLPKNLKWINSTSIKECTSLEVISVNKSNEESIKKKLYIHWEHLSDEEEEYNCKIDLAIKKGFEKPELQVEYYWTINTYNKSTSKAKEFVKTFLTIGYRMDKLQKQWLPNELILNVLTFLQRSELFLQSTSFERSPYTLGW